MPRSLTERSSLRELLWESSVLLAAELTSDGAIVAANPALERWAGRPLAGTPVAEIVSPPQAPAVLAALGRATDEAWTAVTVGFSAGGAAAAEDRVVRLLRTASGVLLVAETASAERDRLVEDVLELNDDLIRAQRQLSRRQRELERAQAEAAAALERVRRLESIMLAGLTSPDLEGVLRTLLEIARDVFRSDRAAVLLRDDDRRHLVIAAAIGIEEETAAAVRVPIGHGVAGSIAATARGRLVADLTSADVVSQYLRAGGGSLAGVPLVLDGEVIGVLHVSSLEVDRFTEEDLRLLERVGERAALAIGHAQLRERERNVAETLQRSLLPAELPEVPGVRIAARYLSRAHGVHVGGDYYDATWLGEGGLIIAIGDVAGKGLDAASTMGHLRSAQRAYAFDGASPTDLVAALDRLVLDVDAMATAVTMLLDPQTRRLTYANAGHPPALRVGRDGTVGWLSDALAPPLGTGWAERPQHELELAAGDRLLLYTDGLVERRGVMLDDGLDALAVAAAASGDDLEAFCDHVVAAMADETGGFDDDVALLAIELD